MTGIREPDGQHEERTDVLAYRVRTLDNRMRDVEAWRRTSEISHVELNGQARQIQQDLTAMRRENDHRFEALEARLAGVSTRLLAFSFAISGSAIVALFSVLIGTGRL